MEGMWLCDRSELNLKLKPKDKDRTGMEKLSPLPGMETHQVAVPVLPQDTSEQSID